MFAGLSFIFGDAIGYELDISAEKVPELLRADLHDDDVTYQAEETCDLDVFLYLMQ
jgi:hypothetical protein